MKKVFLAAKVHIQDPVQAVRSILMPCCSRVGFLVVDNGQGGRGTEEPSLFFRKRRVCNNPPQSLRPDLISVFGFVLIQFSESLFVVYKVFSSYIMDRIPCPLL